MYVIYLYLYNMYIYICIYVYIYYIYIYNLYDTRWGVKLAKTYYLPTNFALMLL